MELNSYLAKLPHVSAACRIARDDELALLYACKVASPAIKARLACLRALDAAAISTSTSTTTTTASVVLETKPPRFGGQV